MHSAINLQCSKLRVHSAPGAHISAAGRTFFGRVRPMCAHFFTRFSFQYTRGVHRKIFGRTISICVHPSGAQNKALISNTDLLCLSWHPLSQLLGGAAVSLGLTAAPPSSWDKGCSDEDHIGNV